MVQIFIPLNGTDSPPTIFYCDPNNLNATCQLLLQDFGQVSYVPTLAGNALYLAIFVTILLIQITQGVLYSTWGYMISMIFGLVLEALGYGARIAMHMNPWASNPFLIQIIGVTIAPIFFSACIYLCLSRLLVIYDPASSFTHFKSPRTYTITFLSVDFLCLLLQAVGGALADTASTSQDAWNGVHIMIAGLALQVASMLTFSALCAHFAYRLVRAGKAVAPEGWEGQTKRKLHAFILGICAATVLILIRSCFRVAELSNGFSGKLANEEVPFMILEGAMIVLATLCLTLFHPGRCLGDQWRIKANDRSEK